IYPLQVFRAWILCSGHLHDVRQFVSAVGMVDEHGVACSGERTFLEQRGLCLDVGVQDGHDGGDLCQGKVVALHDLDRVLERLEHPHHHSCVPPVRLGDDNVQPRAVV
ncbi:unnamed protein product, partial [Pylaiella littoralis]